MRYSRGPDTIEAYVAYPPESRAAKVVTVMHGNAGMPADIRGTVELLAASGYVALAANPTSREPDPRQIPREMLQGRDFGDRYIEDTRAGLAALRRDRIGREGPIGVVGFCGGGYCGLLWSDTPHRAEVGALVGMHVALRNYQNDGEISRTRPQGIDLYRSTVAPCQFHYGTADPLTPESDISEARGIAMAQSRIFEAFRYEGAGHGFALSTDDNHHPGHAAAAHERALRFLGQNLR
jgi:carboxymethylenebutenolidase